MSKVQLMISTMHQTDYSLLERMNVQTDAIVVNQCNRNEIEEFEFRGNHIKWISLAEKGVGLSRNTALMRATGDILVFADDDVTYADGYESMILKAYEKHPKAGMIVFNVPSVNLNRMNYIIKKDVRIPLIRSLRYGTYRFTVKRTELLKKNIFFSLLYGGGARYQAGEDCLFISQVIQSGIQVVASAMSLGTVNHQDSTWFQGYTEKYYIDKGVWLANAFPVLKHLYIFYFAYRMRHNTEQFGFRAIYKLMKKGFEEFREMQ